MGPGFCSAAGQGCGLAPRPAARRPHVFCGCPGLWPNVEDGQHWKLSLPPYRGRAVEFPGVAHCLATRTRQNRQQSPWLARTTARLGARGAWLSGKEVGRRVCVQTAASLPPSVSLGLGGGACIFPQSRERPPGSVLPRGKLSAQLGSSSSALGNCSPCGASDAVPAPPGEGQCAQQKGAQPLLAF